MPKSKFFKLSEIKPTWETVGFDEQTEDIPKITPVSYAIAENGNPMDPSAAIHYAPKDERNTHVYYLPKTGKIRYADNPLTPQALSKLYETDVSAICGVEDNPCTRLFAYTMIIDRKLVIRIFEIRSEFQKGDFGLWCCRVSSIKELYRYVFGSVFVTCERRDHTQTLVKPEQIETEGIYDTLKGPESNYLDSLKREFVRQVEITHKEDILEALRHLKKRRFADTGIYEFVEIYRMAVEEESIGSDVPKRIRRELKKRRHVLRSAVRIQRDLSVIVMSEFSELFFTPIELRLYFDRDRMYLFRKNPVNGRWKREEVDYPGSFSDHETLDKDIDRELFRNTCLEKYVIRLGDTEHVYLRDVLVQALFLCAEQAAKTGQKIYAAVRANICEGTIRDHTASLPEILGITGPQIKFLDRIKLPRNLIRLSELIRSEDFKQYFPDIKKRIFAAAFYENSVGVTAGPGFFEYMPRLEREDVFAAAPTLNALERRNDEDREQLITEYRDYLEMHRTYKNVLEDAEEWSLMRQRVEALAALPVNMKPSRIREYHRRIARPLNPEGAAYVDLSQNNHAIRKRKETEAESWEYADDVYVIRMPEDAEDIVREGEKLQHCVGRTGYIGMMAHFVTTILFLRKKEKPDDPFLTLEIRDGKIMQCYGFRDNYNREEGVRDFLQEYAKEHDLEIEAVIYAKPGEKPGRPVVPAVHHQLTPEEIADLIANA